MEYRQHIQKVIDYIEENLTVEIDINELANVAGYSKYHFIKLFFKTTGMTPAEYIRKRRITEIVKEMADSEESISDIAFRYGFNSKENFTRAFKQEHKVLPSEFRYVENSLKLCEKIQFEKEKLDIVPEIMTLDQMIFITYKSDEEDMTKFWNKYNCKKMSEKLSGGKVVLDYGISEWLIDEQRTEYHIGIEEKYAIGNREGTEKIIIAPRKYAVFNTPVSDNFNFIKIIKDTWDYILYDWLENNGVYEHAGGPNFETYIESSRTFSEKIYVPIKERGK